MKRNKVKGIIAATIAATLLLGVGQSASSVAGLSVKVTCKRAGFVAPQIMTLEMVYPGKERGVRRQVVNVSTRYEAMPRECAGRFRRVSLLSVWLQNSRNPGKWFRLTFPKWLDLFPPYENSLIKTGGNLAGEGGASISSNGHQGRNVYYRCSPGKRKTRVRAYFRGVVKNVRTGRTIGKKTVKKAVKVRGGGC